MIVALIIGRKGSIGFPGKNTFPIYGKPLAWYPMKAAQNAKLVDKVYMSTDDPVLKDLAKSMGIEVIERPAHLCTKEALGEDAFVHGYQYITNLNGEKPELLVLLFANAPTLTSATIDHGIEVLRNNSNFDSAVTVSRYNMWSPLRARQISDDGLLHPFISFENFGSKKLTCDRDSQGDVWFADVAVSVVKPANLDNIEHGILPQKWMGRKIYPLKQEAGCDVDFEWQIPIVEWWIKKYNPSALLQ